MIHRSDDQSKPNGCLTTKSTIRIRQDFIDYFRNNEHKFAPPSKVFNDDPTLLFVNAGMNQFKKIFLGQENDHKYSKLTNSQICIRAGGKHNDLDDVGYDSYHLTSFEMLGSWSLNDYQKEKAIELSFIFLTEKCKLQKNRLYVTYFGGNDDIPPDNDSKEIWNKYLPNERIIPGSFSDNFWMMADEGPCGVSTEIHYDLIGDRLVPELVNKDNNTVIEIWNNVFIQYKKDRNGYSKLDKFYVDTGMGLERLSMVIQNKSTIYETDAFRYLFGYAQAISNGPSFYDKYDGNKVDIAYRIFADHFRTVVVALFDGVKFEITGRGCVLRKIFRRLLTYFYLYLNNFTIEQKMTHLCVQALISDVLIFHLKKNHNAANMQSILIEEENLYIGHIRYVTRLFDNKVKKSLKQSNEVSIDKINKELKESTGIPTEIIEHKEKLIFK